jgi:radical SAM protein with 4Fe4S-binding SPASM domain
LAERLGVNSFKINRIDGICRGQLMHKEGLCLDVAECIKLQDKIDQEIRPRHKLEIIFDIPPAFRTLKDIMNKSNRCSIKNILGVLSDGSISICGIGEVVSSLRIGDIRQTKLSEIWQTNELLRIIRRDIPGKLEGVCGRCILKAYCLGKCRASEYYKNGNILGPFYFCQQAYDQGLFPERNIIDNN